MRHIRKCQDTLFGQTYGLQDIHTIQDFHKQVPISDYESYQNWIIPMARGEANIAIPGTVERFATSSGTTGQDKLIPVTKRFLRNNHYKGPLLLMKTYCQQNPRTHLFSGKTIVIGGKLGTNPYTGKNNIGYISAILQKNAPFYLQYFKVPKDSITYLEDRETKINKIIEQSVHKKVVCISGLPSRCSQFLEKACHKTNQANATSIRPQLELVMWGGMSLDLYKKKFYKLLPNPDIKYYQLYNASEGFFAFQDKNNTDDMRLLIDADIFYEFIPIDQYHQDNPQVYTLQEVEIQREYAMIITTSAGLRRYDIGDTVVFTSLNPYRIRVQGRTKYYIDLASDKCYLHHFQQALHYACEQAHIQCLEYTVGPNITNGCKPKHERIIETQQSEQDATKFAQLLDEGMQQANVYYRDERNDTKTIDPPIVHFLAPGAFYTRLKQHKKLGGQFKIPRVANHDKYIHSLLSLHDDHHV